VRIVNIGDEQFGYTMLINVWKNLAVRIFAILAAFRRQGTAHGRVLSLHFGHFRNGSSSNIDLGQIARQPM
jgi:hypothetical protein